MKTANKLFYALAFAIFSFPLCNGAAQDAQQAQSEEQIAPEAAAQLKEQKEFLAQCIRPGKGDTIAKYLATTGGLLLRGWVTYKGLIAFENSQKNSFKVFIMKQWPKNVGKDIACKMGILVSIPGIGLFIESLISAKFSSKEINRAIPVVGGAGGTFLYSLYHDYTSKKRLRQTLAAFEKTPEKFSEQAAQLLKTTNSNLAQNLSPMEKWTEMTKVYQQLYAMTE